MDIDSVLNLYKKTYLNLPRPVKSFFGSLYGSIPLQVRFGSQYRIHKSNIEKFENSSKQFQLDYMYNKTYETLQFAYENIPHYTNIFNAFDVKPSDFKSLEDIKKFPCLTKKMVQENLKNLYTSRFQKSYVVHTGGSTFTPTKFYLSLETSRAKERAYNNYIFSKLGYKYRDKTLVLRDKVRILEKECIYWDYEMVANQLWISPNHINERYIEKILGEVKNFMPKFIWGYPSAISSFVDKCKIKGLTNLGGVSGIFLTSEIVFPEQMDKISKFFNCQVISHYGHSEVTSIGYRINKKQYHFLNSYGLPRVVDNEIISTSFDNLVMPFINYKTQDYVMGECHFIDSGDIIVSVENIEGRLQEFIVTKNGTIRAIMGIGMGHFDNYSHVNAAQYYQDTPGKLTINIESQYSEKVQVKEIINRLEESANNEISFDIKFVDKIEKTSRGKWKTVIQKLDVDKFK